MKLWTILLFIIPIPGYSQCKELDKLDFGGTLRSKTRNHIPFHLDTIDTIQHCCDIRKIKTYSDFIVSNAKAYIVARANEDFFGRLEINQIDVNYPDSIIISYQNQSLYNLSSFNVSYWVTYTYSINNIQYGFGLEFNKKGEMISENKFPDFSRNKNFQMLTDVCDALSLVKNDERFRGKEFESVELAYVDDANSFCWLVKEKFNPSKCGTTNYSFDLYYVNANTNKLEVVKQKTGTVTVCCSRM